MFGFGQPRFPVDADEADWLVTCLAMMVRLSQAGTAAVERELKPYLRGVFRKAVAATDRAYPDLPATLEAVDLADWA